MTAPQITLTNPQRQLMQAAKESRLISLWTPEDGAHYFQLDSTDSLARKRVTARVEWLIKHQFLTTSTTPHPRLRRAFYVQPVQTRDQ